MRRSIAWGAAVLLLAGGSVFSAAQKKPAPKKSSTSTAKKKTAAKKSASSRRSRSTRRRPAITWRNRQTAPAPERYRQIQQALIDKGYLEGKPTGVWNQASIDALRRFQDEQNLNATGKIDSLSLIALGLGPKYDTAATAPPDRPPQP